MNIMVIGGGGREHAIIKKLRENPSVETIWCLPGNGGIASDAVCVPVGAKDLDGICAFARENPVDFAVVAPDDPLVLGAVDRLQELGIPCFGPDKKAAQIEGSKIFSKNLMKKYGIPTAAYESFTDADAALSYLNTAAYPLYIKADGLALGKGAVYCEDQSAAEETIRTMMIDRAFGESGAKVVVEEFLTGPEVTVLAFTDGKAIVPMVSSMDHKKALDGDEGLNTGGMGTIAPNPLYTEEIAAYCQKEIFEKTVAAMNAENRPFKGCLYIGLILTQDGPKVIEYNCRFGDPEAQVVLPLLKTDLLSVFRAIESETLSDLDVEFSDGAACCVVVASGGYPGPYKTDCPIELNGAENFDGVTVYHAGTKILDGALVTAGGRVLGVTAVSEDLPEAIWKAYRSAAQVHFENAYYRRDIGKRALAGGK